MREVGGWWNEEFKLLVEKKKNCIVANCRDGVQVIGRMRREVKRKVGEMKMKAVR